MSDFISSRFGGAAAGTPPASTAAGPSLMTSIYDTHLGLAFLSWSRTVLGLSLRVDLRLSYSSSGYGDGEKEEKEEILRLRIRPWLFWKRRGFRRFRVKIGLSHGDVDIAWDLSRARFPAGGCPEPSSGFFVAIAVDGEMVLVAGDMEEEANRQMKVKRPTQTVALLLRREHVMLKTGAGAASGRTLYRTTVIVAGREREIAIEISGKEESAAGMCVAIHGEKVLQVRRLRWKFRGSERVQIDAGGGGGIQISWDLHSWLFPSKAGHPSVSIVGATASDNGQAVFVFRFEKGNEGGSVKKENIFSSGTAGTSGSGGSGSFYRGSISGYLGRNMNCSESSSCGGGGGGGGERRKGRKKNLLKTSSSSSSSSASSAGSSSVMEWASREEAELRGIDGFTLVVYASKN